MVNINSNLCTITIILNELDGGEFHDLKVLIRRTFFWLYNFIFFFFILYSEYVNSVLLTNLFYHIFSNYSNYIVS